MCFKYFVPAYLHIPCNDLPLYTLYSISTFIYLLHVPNYLYILCTCLSSYILYQLTFISLEPVFLDLYRCISSGILDRGRFFLTLIPRHLAKGITNNLGNKTKPRNSEHQGFHIPVITFPTKRVHNNT